MSRVAARVARSAAVLLLALAPAACSPQEPEISLQMQVPAEMRADESLDAGEASEPEATAGEQIVFEAHELAFEGVPETVPAGEHTLVLDNQGNLPHDVTIAELDSSPLAVADGGAQDTAAVSLEPGTYTYYCSIPGHRPGGMEGTLTVTD